MDTGAIIITLVVSSVVNGLLNAAITWFTGVGRIGAALDHYEKTHKK